MSHRERRRIVTLAVAILVITFCLGVNPSEARSWPPGTSVATTTALESAAQGWRALIAYWLPLLRPADAARIRSQGDGASPLRTPTCGAGSASTPNLHCAGGNDRPPVQLPACGAGPAPDPNGGCLNH